MNLRILQEADVPEMHYSGTREQITAQQTCDHVWVFWRQEPCYRYELCERCFAERAVWQGATR